MKRIHTLGLAILVACLAAPTATAQDKPAKPSAQPPKAKQANQKQGERGTPKLQLSTAEWDFGEKWYGEPCETEITLKNVGDAPLRITKVTSSCGCTVAKPKSAATWNGLVLKPGEGETMKLSYNTKKLRAKVSQTVTVQTNDPLNPTVQIMVKGSIKQVFSMKPAERITFTGLDRTSEQTKSLTLTSNLEDEKVSLKLKELPENVPFDVKLEAVEEGVSYKLTVTTKPPLKLGSNAIAVTLLTDHPKFKTVTVPVSAYIAPRVQISPSILYVPRQGSASIQRYVRLRYNAVKEVKITDIQVSDDSVKAEVMPPRIKPNPKATVKMHEIRVTLPPASEFPKDGATITVLTDDDEPEYQKFEIKVLLQPDTRRANSSARAKAAARQAAGKAGAKKKETVDKGKDDEKKSDGGKSDDD
ncbi:MAG: DUF1573 domain-containing protein [Planctomycetota bacterium]|nr:MAG: DUF1573 domain-containing protein [Planctomycetota bacterium]